MRRLFILLALTATVGCYHATIDTGLTPSGQTIDKPWANSFVYGLVPPPVVETTAKCANGVARVETQQTFLNGLVNALTGGIYTPMRITVQCAAQRTADATVIHDADVARGLEKAADLAVATSEVIYLEMR
jgi:hypothetical protein